MDIRRNLFLARSCKECGTSNTLFFTFLSGEGDWAGKYPGYYAKYQNPYTHDYLVQEAPRDLKPVSSPWISPSTMITPETI